MIINAGSYIMSMGGFNAHGGNHYHIKSLEEVFDVLHYITLNEEIKLVSHFMNWELSPRPANLCSESQENDISFESIFGLPHHIVCIHYVLLDMGSCFVKLYSYFIMWYFAGQHYFGFPPIFHLFWPKKITFWVIFCRPALAECWHLWSKTGSHR